MPPVHVYDADRAEIVPFVPASVTSILDVGCGSGSFGRLLRQRFGDVLRLEGIEPVAAAREAARTKGFDRVREGFFPQAVEAGERFDCIVFNDVLEHILDPDETLRVAREHLGDGGVVVASIPNILYLPVLARVIVRRRWDYTDEGTLDRTHVRFFTRANIVELFEQTGYEVQRIEGINNQWYTGRWGRLQLLARFVGQFQYQQFAVVARAGARG
jgi:2-polyprenyl-3-methyl-5-hydroxy-6-metoxy-1,4-benzoquinol methylase